MGPPPATEGNNQKDSFCLTCPLSLGPAGVLLDKGLPSSTKGTIKQKINRAGVGPGRLILGHGAEVENVRIEIPGLGFV